MLMEFSAGHFFYFDYLSPDGQFSFTAQTDQPPPASLLEISKTIPEFAPYEYTTFVTINGIQVGTLSGGDVGGDALEFSAQEIDVSWYGFDFPTGHVHMGRITFSEDAVGQWGLFVVGNEVNDEQVSIETYGGIAEIIPEPAAAAWMTLGLTALIRHRRLTRSRA